MALDSFEKRISAAGAGRPWMRGRLAVGSNTTRTRMASGGAYAGNALNFTDSGNNKLLLQAGDTDYLLLDSTTDVLLLEAAAVGGNLFMPLAADGGLAGAGGLAGKSGGLAG